MILTMDDLNYSNEITHISYDNELWSLYIKFVSPTNRTYVYKNVNPNIWVNFCAAADKYGFFKSVISPSNFDKDIIIDGEC